MVKQPHVLVLPWPAQGHVIPMMQVSQKIVANGVKVTFSITVSLHNQLLVNLSSSLKEGVRNDHNQNRLINEETDGGNNGEEKVSCVIADAGVYWDYEPAKKMGLKIAMLCPTSLAVTEMTLHIPKLIQTSIIDENGVPIKKQILRLSPTVIRMTTDHLVWSSIGDKDSQRSMFRYINSNNEASKDTGWWLCISFHELESPAYPLNPDLLSLGPLLARSQLTGNFWTEDITCLNWLDGQPAKSVVYVAFGSFTVFDKQLFHEVALGLENAGQPFMWVVRPDLTEGSTDDYPHGFQEIVASKERMAIACYVTHCGWNSTMEGITSRVPFICWPYFADQFLNQCYICDVWQVGLQLNKNDDGIAALLADETIRIKSVSEGEASMKNIIDFIESVKGKRQNGTKAERYD
ncbi:hypothetical protein MKX01_008604 [Papaver californicum]|nr:hypothetical protein MKX01_008604 [Papaver californicum]